MLPPINTPEFVAARYAAMFNQRGFVGVDATDPTNPSGHAYAVRVSSRLTTDYRKRLKRCSVDVTPEEVIDCMIQADIKQWVLIGLHGYVGYLPMPRATQDVDVMVPYSQKFKATQAIATRWPMLTQVTLSQVIRFIDPTDLDSDGKGKPVVDLMFPWSPFQETILTSCVVVDPSSGSRYPTLEAALVSKYAALVSPHRSSEKKEQDAVDFRRIARANCKDLDRDKLRTLGNQVWEGGGEEILLFVDLTLADKQLPL